MTFQHPIQNRAVYVPPRSEGDLLHRECSPGGEVIPGNQLAGQDCIPEQCRADTLAYVL